MKSVGQIQRQGKGKDVRASAAASGLPTEEIDSTVALIQALIPLGVQAVGEALAAEVTALAGTRYCRTGGRLRLCQRRARGTTRSYWFRPGPPSGRPGLLLLTPSFQCLHRYSNLFRHQTYMALSGGNNRATALFLNASPYRAISHPYRPQVQDHIGATTILTRG